MSKFDSFARKFFFFFFFKLEHILCIQMKTKQKPEM